MQSNDVTITVINPEERKEIAGINKYFVYTVRGTDQHESIDILRRYSDFFLVREILVKRWPGTIVPSLPEKKTIGSAEHAFVQSRRRGLERFLIDLSLVPHLWNSKEVQTFLRYKGADNEKELQPLVKQSYEHTLNRYQQVFPHLKEIAGKEDATDSLDFGGAVSQTKTILDKLIELAENIHQRQRKLHEKKLTLLQFGLPDYERHCLYENDEKKRSEDLLFLCAQQNGIGQAQQQWKQTLQFHPSQRVEDELKREKREAESLEETLKVRQDLEQARHKATGRVKDLEVESSKIKAGNLGLLAKIKKTSKESLEAENEKELANARQEEKDYIQLCDLVSALLKQEVDRFRQARQKAYFAMLKNLWLEERRIGELEREIWVNIGHHDRINLAVTAIPNAEDKKLKKQPSQDKEEKVDKEEESKQEQKNESEPEVRKEETSQEEEITDL